MSELFQTIVCTVPAELERAAALHLPLACMGFGVGKNLALISRTEGKRVSGCFMVLDDTGYDRSPGDISVFAAECLSLCRTLELCGLLLDFEQPVRRELEILVSECAERFIRTGFPVYLPERYARCHPSAKIYIPTALTSGSLRARLQKAAETYGAGRLVLEMERLTRDIALPSPGGFGRAMTQEELRVLLTARNGASFYSSEMCTHYFTGRDSSGATHFYLYDDARSFRAKTELAVSMGIRQGFVLYPDAVALRL